MLRLSIGLISLLFTPTWVPAAIPDSFLPNGLYPAGPCEGRASLYESKGWSPVSYRTEIVPVYFNGSHNSEGPHQQHSQSWPLLRASSQSFWVQLQPSAASTEMIVGLADQQGHVFPTGFNLRPQLSDADTKARFFREGHRAIGLAISDQQDFIALGFNTPSLTGTDAAPVLQQRSRFVLIRSEVLQQKLHQASFERDTESGLFMIPNEAVAADATIVGSMATLASGRKVPPGSRFYTLPLEMKFSPDGRYLVARNDHELEIFRFRKGILCRLEHAIAYPQLTENFTAKHIVFSSESDILRFIGWDAQHTSREAFDLSLDHLSCVK